MRIGIFGGAFDPPHVAHLALVQAALHQLALDSLRIFPTGQAWHKARNLSSAEHRLAMVRLAFGELPRVVVDTREIDRDGPTYTVETLRELCGEYPGAELVLIVGTDQARDFTRWHEWREILAMATISIANRAQSATSSATPIPWQSEPGARVEHIVMAPMETNSTDIRQRAAAGLPTSPLVSGPVARYIAQHHLYQPT